MKKIAVTVLATCLTCGVYAADNELAATSTDTVPLTLDIPALVRISGFTGIDFGTFDGVNHGYGHDEGCIYSNSNGSFTLTVTSTNGEFKLSNGLGDTIAYLVYGGSDDTGTRNINYNTESAEYPGADTADPDCGGGTNAAFSITIHRNYMLAVPHGTYQDDLLVLVSPYL